MTSLLWLAWFAAASPASAAEPLAPDEAVLWALDHNPTLIGAQLDLERAGLLVHAEEHRYRPTATASVGLNTGQKPSLAGTDIALGESSQWSGSLGVAQETPIGTTFQVDLASGRARSNTVPVGDVEPYVLGPSADLTARATVTQSLISGAGLAVGESSIRQARISQTSQEATLRQTTSETLRDVLTGYWELFYATRSLEIQQEALDTAQRQRDEAAAKLSIGSIAPADLPAFDSRVASLEESLIAAESDQRSRIITLQRLLGGTPATPTTTGELPEAPPLNTADLETLALAASPSVVAQESAVDLAKAQGDVATDPYKSRLDLTGWLQAEGLAYASFPDAFSMLATNPAVSGYVGLDFSGTLDPTRRKAEHDRAELSVQSASQRLTAVQDSALAELRTAIESERSARARVTTAERTVAATEAQLASERERVVTGSGLPLAVRVAEDDSRSAALRLERARVDLVEAQLNVAHLTGQLLGQLGITIDG